MEANGKMIRLLKAKENSESVKLIFQYPSANHAIIKSGKVLAVHIDSFTIDEIYDGEATYSYDFLVEIKEVEK